MNGFTDTLKALGPVRLGILGAVGVATLIFFIFITSRIGTSNMELLYGDLSTSDAGAIAAELDAQQIPYEVSPDGTRIRVPADKVPQLRMRMAQQGLPSGGMVGSEIFDEPQGFGMTNFIQNINQRRALEGELARTVSTLNNIKSARVHLVLPKRELFSRTANKATASVFVTMRSPGRPPREQIQAIQHVVAAAVPQLDPNNVSVVDQNGSLLARGNGQDAADTIYDTAKEQQIGFESRMARRVEDLLAQTVGYGNARAEVSAELDFDRVTTSEEIYDPEGQVLRSTATTEELNESSDSQGVDTVSIGNNLPDADFGGDSSNTSSERGNRSQTTENYEISRTKRTHVKAVGSVKRLSVAVLVDGNYVTKTEGETTTQEYQPRSADELKNIEALVKRTIGFDESRGDSVEIINMRFAVPEAEPAPEGLELLGFEKQDMKRIIEIVVLGIVAIMVILIVIRPLLNRLLDAGGSAELTPAAAIQAGLDPALAGAAVGANGMITDQTIAGQLEAPNNLPVEHSDPSSEIERMLDLSQVEGKIRASSIKQVGDIISDNPEEAVAIVRNWLYQESA